MVSFEKHFYKHASEFRLTKTFMPNEAMNPEGVVMYPAACLFFFLRGSWWLSGHLDLLSSYCVFGVDLGFRNPKITKISSARNEQGNEPIKCHHCSGF